MERINFSIPITQKTIKDNDLIISGVAINAVKTRNGITFKSEDLEKSAATLRDKPILKDHNNSVDAIVGRTTQNINFKDNKVNFEAVIKDKEVSEKIKDGRIKNVSIGAMVDVITEKDEEHEEHFAKNIDFVELSLVAVPADPNAGIEEALDNKFSLSSQVNAQVKTMVTCKTKEMEENTMSENNELEQLKLEKAKMIEELEKLELEKIKLQKENAEKELQTEKLKQKDKIVEDKTQGQVNQELEDDDEEENPYVLQSSNFGGWALTPNIKAHTNLKRLRRD